MAYQSGSRLPSERASKLGHLGVIESKLVNKLVEQFEKPENDQPGAYIPWIKYSVTEKPLRLIFAVDGSLQPIRSDNKPYRELVFIKTALLRLDQVAMGKVDQNAPHPLQLRDLLADAALYHSTVLPLKLVSVPGLTNYDAIREIIYESLRDASLNGEPFETLKWLAYEKWTDSKSNSPKFSCPHCMEESKGLPYDSEIGQCEHCNGKVYLSDVLGFHLDMAEDSAPLSIGTAYMLIHETLLIFTGIRHFWEQKKFNILKECLFIKDGPLTLRSHYSKLVIPIRKFFEHAKKEGVEINLFGQEKTGIFVDHLELIALDAPVKSYFLPSNNYIRQEIQHSPDRGEPYGLRTNYGNKIFIKTDEYHYVVLSIPTGSYKDNASIEDLLGIKRILSTLETIISNRHHGALLPVQLANGIASLSTYPSAKILKIFADL